ncbi:hypothetical protein JOB18_026326 [Solea senegalensis]|nr:hypothetical protein JOB18_026326 [Solea senegalensis]
MDDDTLGACIQKVFVKQPSGEAFRQKVGSRHVSEVVVPAGEGGAPGRPRQGENKHDAGTRQ